MQESLAVMDFLLNDESIVVEVKTTRQSLKDKDISDQLIIDKERYKFSGSKSEAGAYKAIVFDALTASLRLGGGVAAAGKMDISR